jgi:hypothetical protein
MNSRPVRISFLVFLYSSYIDSSQQEKGNQHFQRRNWADSFYVWIRAIVVNLKNGHFM